MDLLPVHELNPESDLPFSGGANSDVAQLHAGVTGELSASALAQAGGVGAVAAEEGVHGVAARVAVLTAVADQYLTAAPSEHDRCAESGWSRADDDDVVIGHVRTGRGSVTGAPLRATLETGPILQRSLEVIPVLGMHLTAPVIAPREI